MSDVIVIGAGLSGAVAAERLAQRLPTRTITVLEARSRAGGRLLSQDGVDLGGAWCWRGAHPRLEALAKRVGVATIPQKYDFGQGRVRFAGGADGLVTALLERAQKNGAEVKFGAQVDRIERADDSIRAVCTDGTVHMAKAAIVALPPQVLSHSLTFSPPLPTGLRSAIAAQPVWMGGMAKVALVYDQPFWHTDRFSELARGGPIVQMYDASDEERFALAGFIAMTEDLTEAAILEQVARLFQTDAARHPTKATIKKWWTDARTLPKPGLHQWHHPDAFPAVPVAGRIAFAGAEFATTHNAGLMEGAIEAAIEAVETVEAWV